MKFENIFTLKRILNLVKQISKENIYINSLNSKKGINFSSINNERTILTDVFIQKEETITNDNEIINFPKNFSFKIGKLFFDIMDTVESGSDVNLEYEEEDMFILINYDDIKLKSELNVLSEDFIGFPKTEKNIVIKLSGEKIAHALNLLSKFRNDIEVKIENNNLILESQSTLGSTKLTMPAKFSEQNNNHSKISIYDYEIIKPLLSAAKLSSSVEVMFNWNKNIEDNVLIAKCNFKDYNGHVRYLFTPKGVINGVS